MLAITANPQVALGFAAWGPSGKPTDLVAEPNNFASLEGDVWTWKMSDQFRSVYDTTLLQDQVRLAVDQWESAFNDAERRTANRWGWVRDNGEQDFYDLQSIVVHELGHALGFQHADASFFNVNGATGLPYSANYRLDDQGDPYVAAPIGGEIMNEGNDGVSLPGSKPPRGIRPGAYWRTLSRDEVAGADYLYGRPVTFVEVGPESDALITFNLINAAATNPSDDLGSAGPDDYEARDPEDPLQGRWITETSAGITALTNRPVGILPRSSSWTYKNNTGEPLQMISVRSDGTSNGEPLATYSSGGNRFTTYEQADTTLLHAFENRGHRFLDPNSGAVSPGALVDFGLTLDVWDWTVDRATAVTLDGEAIGLPLIALHDWNHGGYDTEGPKAPVGPINVAEGFGDSHQHGLTSVPDGAYRVDARGFRIASGETDLLLKKLGFAAVGDLGLGLEDLNEATLMGLEADNRVVELPFEPRRVEANSDLTIVLDGLLDDLPFDLQQSGDFVLLNDARWVDALAKGEVLIYGRTSDDAGDMIAFSLINTRPISGRTVPEPAALCMAALLIMVSGAQPRGRLS